MGVLILGSFFPTFSGAILGSHFRLHTCPPCAAFWKAFVEVLVWLEWDRGQREKREGLQGLIAGYLGA